MILLILLIVLLVVLFEGRRRTSNEIMWIALVLIIAWIIFTSVDGRSLLR